MKITKYGCNTEPTAKNNYLKYFTEEHGTAAEKVLYLFVKINYFWEHLQI